MYTGLSISLCRLEPRASTLQSQSASCLPKRSTGQVPSQPFHHLGLSGAKHHHLYVPLPHYVISKGVGTVSVPIPQTRRWDTKD